YVWTQDYMQAVNQVATLGYSVSVLSQIAQSRFRGGIGTSISYTYFDSDIGVVRGRTVDVRSMQTELTLGLSPTLQYRFNDRFNVYTSLQLLTYTHSRDQAGLAMERRPISQNVGLGIAVLRDLYLSPNLDFRPKELSSEKTSVN